jgi:hypothetical protein
MQSESNLPSVVTIASSVVGFGAVVLMFRIQRELYVQEVLKLNVNWIARADWLVIVAIMLAGLLGLILPLSGFTLSGIFEQIPTAACLSAVILLLGYVFAILAHYRLLGNSPAAKEDGSIPPRSNPEPPEGLIFWVTLIIAALSFGGSVYLAH